MSVLWLEILCAWCAIDVVDNFSVTYWHISLVTTLILTHNLSHTDNHSLKNERLHLYYWKHKKEKEREETWWCSHEHSNSTIAPVNCDPPQLVHSIFTPFTVLLLSSHNHTFASHYHLSTLLLRAGLIFLCFEEKKISRCAVKISIFSVLFFFIQNYNNKLFLSIY